MKKILFGFTTLALAIASAASNYNVTFFQPSIVNGTELKAGDYKIQLDGNKAIVKSGKHVAQADVKVETTDNKFSTTTVRYTKAGDGKLTVQEIRLGGTNSKIVFTDSGASANSSAGSGSAGARD